MCRLHISRSYVHLSCCKPSDETSVIKQQHQQQPKFYRQGSHLLALFIIKARFSTACSISGLAASEAQPGQTHGQEGA